MNDESSEKPMSPPISDSSAIIQPSPMKTPAKDLPPEVKLCKVLFHLYLTIFYPCFSPSHTASSSLALREHFSTDAGSELHSPLKQVHPRRQRDRHTHSRPPLKTTEPRRSNQSQYMNSILFMSLMNLYDLIRPCCSV